MLAGDGVEKESRTSRVVRGMNTIRIPMYLCVVWIQLTLLSESIAADAIIDLGTVLVPLGLAALDAMMVTWISKRETGVSSIGFILSCVSLAVALNSLRPYQWSFMFGFSRPLLLDEILMIWLGAMVALVSIVELAAILYESLHLTKETPFSMHVIRTYET